MSAFEYYAKNSLPLDRKRKNKKKIKKMQIKKPKTKENSTYEEKKNDTKKGYIDLNNIYSINLKNSTKTGQKLLEWLIHPYSIEDFMR